MTLINKENQKYGNGNGNGRAAKTRNRRVSGVRVKLLGLGYYSRAFIIPPLLFLTCMASCMKGFGTTHVEPDLSFQAGKLPQLL